MPELEDLLYEEKRDYFIEYVDTMRKKEQVHTVV
jgi:hypothetical protein